MEQSFGKIGNPQRQINVLGNVNTQHGVKSLYFVLNNSSVHHQLTWGCDKYRLARPGDFNIEIERDSLIVGKNEIRIVAVDTLNNKTEKQVSMVYAEKNKWPLPYQVKWSKVTNIQNAVQVVDGHWELTENGLRVKDKYYDRVLAFGDSSWKNYAVETSVIFHSVSPRSPGPPTFNVCHVAIASRWPGHDFDKTQPNRKWYPLGATSEFTVSEDLKDCWWRIFDGENFMAKDTLNRRSIHFEKKYNLKHRVETQKDNSTLYSVKLWDASLKEPQNWDFQAIEPPGDLPYGSALLLAHNTEVTFGDIYVRNINP